MQQINEYVVVKNYVRFQCPGCRELINTNLVDAGILDHCPVCNTQFYAPGSVENLKRIEIASSANQLRLLKQDEKRLAKEASRVAKQQKLEEQRKAVAQKRMAADAKAIFTVDMAEPPPNQHADTNIPVSRKWNRKRVILTGLAAAVAATFCYPAFGIFIVQPIGAVPDGTSVLYWRYGLNLPFVASADGVLIDNEIGVSLLTRAITLGKLSEMLGERKILTLPYSRTLYLWTTGGKEFEE